MKYISKINNLKALEWGLTLAEAFIFEYIYEIPSWAKYEIIDNELWYWACKKTILKELPLLTDKMDTIYRHYKSLVNKGLIKYKFKNKKDYIQLTEKAKEWNFKEVFTMSEKNPSKIENFKINDKKSEKNPSKKSKKSEKNPTYHNTNIINPNTNINTKEINNIISLVDDNISLKNKKSERGTEIPPQITAAPTQKEKDLIKNNVLFENIEPNNINESLKENNHSNRRKNKEKMISDNPFNEMVNVFCEWHKNYKKEDYTFIYKGRDSRDMKQIQIKIETRLMNINKIKATKEETINSFTQFLEWLPKLQKNSNIYKFFQLSKLANNFDTISTEIRELYEKEKNNSYINPFGTIEFNNIWDVWKTYLATQYNKYFYTIESENEYIMKLYEESGKNIENLKKAVTDSRIKKYGSVVFSNNNHYQNNNNNNKKLDCMRDFD